MRLYVQTFELVHISGIHSYTVHESSTSGCASAYFVVYSTLPLFQPFFPCIICVKCVINLLGIYWANRVGWVL